MPVVRATDILAVAVAVAATGIGLGVLAAGATTSAGWTAPPKVVTAVLLGLWIGVMIAAIMVARRGAIVRSVVAGLAFGGSAVTVRALLVLPGATGSVSGLLGQPLLYVVIGFAAVGVPMYAAALGHSAPSVPSAIVTMIEVIFPGAIAMVLLGDRIRSGWWPASCAGLVVAALGVTVLATRGATGAHRTGQGPTRVVPVTL